MLCLSRPLHITMNVWLVQSAAMCYWSQRVRRPLWESTTRHYMSLRHKPTARGHINAAVDRSRNTRCQTHCHLLLQAWASILALITSITAKCKSIVPSTWVIHFKLKYLHTISRLYCECDLFHSLQFILKIGIWGFTNHTERFISKNHLIEHIPLWIWFCAMADSVSSKPIKI